MRITERQLDWELLGAKGGRGLPFTEGLACKLALDATLHGHGGCVNRLAWNQEGSLLASGSDDCQVMLWHYPDTAAAPLALQTEHRANIFGVQFLPHSNSSRLVSGAMDNTVQLHELDTPPGALSAKIAASRSGRRGEGLGSGGGRGADDERPRQAAPHMPPPVRVQPRSTVYQCHRGRVKDVEVSPGEPHLFWSASEDGCVRQFDTRVAGQKSWASSNCLLTLVQRGALVELKSLDICQPRPHLLAIACDDACVRVYDRRMLSCCQPDEAIGAAAPLLTLAPPHLQLAWPTQARLRAHPTYVNFNSRGDKLVASYHGDHAYSFDVSGPGLMCGAHPTPSSRAAAPGAAAPAGFPSAAVPRHRAAWHGWGCRGAGAASGRSGGVSCSEAALPAAAEWAKAAGNRALFEHRAPAAVQAFSQALELAPWSPQLLAQRALALLQRGWVGDAVFALADADAAIAPASQRPQGGGAELAAQHAYHRRVQALQQLQQYEAALCALSDYQLRYPAAASAEEVQRLQRTICMELAHREANDRQRRERCLKAQRQRHAAAATPGRPAAGGGGDASGAVTSEPASAGGGTGSQGSWERAGAAAFEIGAGFAGGSSAGSSSAGSDGEDSESDGNKGGGRRGAPAAQHAASPRAGASSSGRGGATHACVGDAGGGWRSSSALWRATPGGQRLVSRFVGHCNVQTDIKEACFLGPGDELVAAGSDDGRVFIYRAEAEGPPGCELLPVQVLQADEDVANCVQAHPHEALLATSGIERTIKLWSPTAAAERPDMAPWVEANQRRMRQGPQMLRGLHPSALAAALEGNPQLLELFVQRLSGRGGGGAPAEGGGDDGSGDDAGDDAPGDPGCRMH